MFWIIAAVFWAFLGVANPAFADQVGTPTVMSGDVLEVAGRRFQLYGIDAPEMDQTCMAQGRRFNCGHIAKTALMDLVAGEIVTCRLVIEHDSNAALGHCTAGGFDLGANMVHTGWALADRQLSTKYVGAEENAQAAKRGLWRGQFIPPWKWRAR